MNTGALIIVGLMFWTVVGMLIAVIKAKIAEKK